MEKLFKQEDVDEIFEMTNKLLEMRLNSDFNYLFTLLVTVVVTLNAITIPLSFNIVTDRLSKYSDKNVYKEFVQERAFMTNIILSFWLLLIFSLPLVFDCNLLKVTKESRFLWIAARQGYIVLSIAGAVGFLMGFYNFSVLLYEYASNTDEIVFRNAKRAIDKFLDNADK